MFCKNCGNSMKENHEFCAVCGTHAEPQLSEEVDAAFDASERLAPNAPAPARQPQAMPAKPARKQENLQRSTANALMATVFIVSCVLAGGFCLRLLIRGIGSSESLSFKAPYFATDLLCFIFIAFSLFGSVFGMVFGHLNRRQSSDYFFKALLWMLGVELFGEVGYLVCELITLNIKLQEGVSDSSTLSLVIMLSVFIITAAAVCFAATILSKTFLKRADAEQQAKDAEAKKLEEAKEEPKKEAEAL